MTTIRTAFQKAIELGCFDILGALQAAVELNLESEDYLLLAVRYRQDSVLSELLELGVDPHSFRGEAFRIAAQEANVTAVRILLGCERADFNSLLDSKGNTLLHWPVSGATDSLEVVQLIIDSGNYTNMANKFKMTPIGLAIVLGREHIVVLLIKYVADINAVCHMIGPQPVNLLTCAVIHNKANIVRLLLRKGACPKVDDPSPMHWGGFTFRPVSNRNEFAKTVERKLGNRNAWMEFLGSQPGNVVYVAILSYAEGALRVLCEEKVDIDWDIALLFALVYLIDSSLEVIDQLLG